jgi:hypothetical protein
MLRPIKFLVTHFSGPSQTPDMFEARIDGRFEGWSGATIFTLLDGQIWQQSSSGFIDHHAEKPTVLIYRSGTGHKMKVEGVSQTISVRRLR